MKPNGAVKPAATVAPVELAQQVHGREDFARFLQAFRESLLAEPEKWENQDLASFLEAMTRWTEDMPGYFKNRGEPLPDPPTWQTFAQVLLAAQVYE